MGYKIGDRVRVISGKGCGKEAVVHHVDSQSSFLIDFGKELGFTHTGSGCDIHPLPKPTGWWVSSAEVELIVEKEGTMKGKLTRKQALDKSIELWEEVVKRGITGTSEKEELCEKMFGYMWLGCPLCEYSHTKGGSISSKTCPSCPYYDEFGFCEDGPYNRWHEEHDIEYAEEFLNQLYVIRGKGVKTSKKETRPEAKFKVGDKVRGTGGAFIGNLYEIESVKWTYQYEYELVANSTAYERNLELAKLEPKVKVGDRVRIKDDWVGKPNKFGGTYMAYSGTVKCINEDSVELKDYHWARNEPEAIELAPEPLPKPKFKKGDRVCFGGIKDVLTIRNAEWLGNHYAYRFEENPNFNSEEYLSLAPPEEKWVDVTKECKVDLYHSIDKEQGSLIRLRHNGVNIFEIGNEGKAWRNTGYKVETTSKEYNASWFRVLKKA